VVISVSKVPVTEFSFVLFPCHTSAAGHLSICIADGDFILSGDLNGYDWPLSKDQLDERARQGATRRGGHPDEIEVMGNEVRSRRINLLTYVF
jgi:hypothetical protein